GSILAETADVSVGHPVLLAGAYRQHTGKHREFIAKGFGGAMGDYVTAYGQLSQYDDHDNIRFLRSGEFLRVSTKGSSMALPHWLCLENPRVYRGRWSHTGREIEFYDLSERRLNFTASMSENRFDMDL